MLFDSTIFILCFLPITFIGFLIAAFCWGRRSSLLWLLGVSLYFYGWWKPLFEILLIASILVNYGFGLKIRSSRPSLRWLILGLSFNLGLLAFFKYSGFIAILFGIKLFSTQIFLPLGISFFTFQQIMFIVDTYRTEIAIDSFIDYACFVAFFPHLIAGPIVRPKHIIPQFKYLTPKGNWGGNLVAGLEVFLLGLAKKLVLADGLARFVDPGFAAASHGQLISLIEAWVALLAYGLQIYFDFSGYSDMAIGLARIFGVHFPENFNSPYKAGNISDFWKRWNITLSGFLRDYLYIPLGGNRHGEARRILNVMITMLLGGLWHGAAMRFVLWGGLHGAFLVIHGWFKQSGFTLPILISRWLTLIVVLLAWVPFRASSFSASIMFYKGLFGFNGILVPAILANSLPFLNKIAKTVPVLPYLGDSRSLSLPQGIMFLCLGWLIVLAFPTVHNLTKTGRDLALIGSFAFTMQALFFAPYTVPFIYFQF